MITYLKKTMSLGNLYRAEIGGQIATILLFIMVLVLIMILFTVNIGQLAVTTTVLANAADSASLFLASQLATHSRILYHALGNAKEKCKKRGLGGIIGGVIGFIVGNILFPGLGFVAAGLLGSTAGGAIGGAIAGPGALQGAIQGLGVGLAIVGAAEIGLNVFHAWYWASALTAIAVTASIYNGVVADKQILANFKEAAKQLRGLDAAVQYRESTYLAALGQVVDDPNVLRDDGNDPRYPDLMGIVDIDADGDTQELVQAYQVWVMARLMGFKNTKRDLRNVITAFIEGPLLTFRDKYIWPWLDDKGALSRCELSGTWRCLCPVGNAFDGNLVKLLRALEDDSQGLARHAPNSQFWKKGEVEPYCLYEDWKENGECADRKIFDSLDKVTAALVEISNSITETEEALKPDGDWGPNGLLALSENWKTWIGVFYYNPEDDLWTEGEEGAPSESEEGGLGGHYYDLESLVNCNGQTCDYLNPCEGRACNKEARYVSLQEWPKILRAVRAGLPECHTWRITNPKTGARKCDNPARIGDTVCNVPCRITDSSSPDGYVATVFDDYLGPYPDEFDDAIADIQGLINQIQTFQGQIKDFYDKMRNIKDSSSTILGGIPVQYDWKDSRGEHSVEVKVSFQMPHIDKETHFSKVCLVLKKAGGNTGGGVAQVRITRNDIPKDEGKVGILGFWNYGGHGNTIIRASQSSYSYGAAPRLIGKKW